MNKFLSLGIISLLIVTLCSGCTESLNETSAASEKSSVDAETSSDMLLQDSEPIIEETQMPIESVVETETNNNLQQLDIGQNNFFTVSYHSDIFYMSSDGIHKLSADGIDELFHPVNLYTVNLYLYHDRLYYWGQDGKIHSIGIQNKDETVIGDGVSTCDFYEDYLFTYIPAEKEYDYKYIGYKIDPQTGTAVNTEIYQITDIFQKFELNNTLMKENGDFIYKDDNGKIISQKIAVINPLISEKLYGGYYYWDIDMSGNVSLTFQPEKEGEQIIYYRKNLENVLTDDLHPTWNSLVTDEGIFFTSLTDNGEQQLPLYYSDQNGHSKEIISYSDNLNIHQLVNFDGQWLYYIASGEVDANGNMLYSCGRVNIDTLEQQQLYTTQNMNIKYEKYVCDIQNDTLFYYDSMEGIIHTIELE